MDRILAKRAGLGPAEASRQLDCRAASTTESYVKAEHIALALQRGATPRTLDRYPHADLPYDEDLRIVHGVDLGARAKRSADLTVIFSLAVHPNRIRQVISVQAFREIGQARLDRLVATHRHFGGTFVVENNAFQQEVIEAFKGIRRVDVAAYTTGKGESSLRFQVDRLVAEITRGEWAIPNINGSCEPQVTAWLDELLG